MREILRHTPLFALRAVAIDTETTGLDPRSSRVIEIAAVTLRNGKVTNDASAHLVTPGVPVPAASTAIHGIDDAALAGAGSFGAVFPAVERFIGERPVIGHTIGFDLAVITRECALAGMAMPAWPTLDVRFLAELVEPALADFSLETLAAWLGIHVGGRHRALADAKLTAEVFVRLVPKLREAGVLTLGDAEVACRSLGRSLETYRAAGFIEPGALPEADRLGPAQRLDTFPYRHRVKDVMRTPPSFVPADTTLRAALAQMINAKVGSVFVGRADAPASELAIATEHDLLRALDRAGPAALDQRITEVATRPLITVPAGAFVYRAIGRMARFGIRHLAAVDTPEQVVGAISAGDLLRLRAGAAIVLGDDIDQAAHVAGLARAWAKVPALAESLLGEKISGRDIAAIVARELGALMRRAGELAIAELRGGDAGPPPCSFALLALGSAGRGESLLALDQDHAVVFEEGEPGGKADRWFGRFGERLSEILDIVGVPLCPGNVMASNPAFRGSLATWRERVARWIDRATPEDLLNADIFFDFRPVLGDGAMAERLWHEAWRGAGQAPSFLRLLAESGQPGDPPIGLLGGLKASEGRIDLKRYGLRPIVQSARLLALRHGVAVRATHKRLKGVRNLEVGGAQDFAAALAAHKRFLMLILRAQLADRAAGRPASNAVPLAIVSKRGGARQLKSDMRLAASLNQLAVDQLAKSPI